MDNVYAGTLHRVACEVMEPLGVDTERMRFRVTPERTEALIRAIQARERLNETRNVAHTAIYATMGKTPVWDAVIGGKMVEPDARVVAEMRNVLKAAEDADHAAMSWAAREIARDMEGVEHPGREAYPRIEYPRPRELV